MKVIFTLFSLMFPLIVYSQSVTSDLKIWTDDELNEYVKNDSTLRIDIQQLFEKEVFPFLKKFDTCRNNGNDNLIRKSLKDLADTLRVKFKKSQKFIAGLSHNTSISHNTTFLYTYCGQLISNYNYSLTNLSSETKSIIIDDDRFNVFNSANFLSAYYSYVASKDALISAMNDLIYYCRLAKQQYILQNSIDSLTKKNGSILTSIESINKKLDTPFVPYYIRKGGPFKSPVALTNKGDKISTAANTILHDQRKNWWWRGLLAGIAGGLVSGLLVKL